MSSLKGKQETANGSDKTNFSGLTENPATHWEYRVKLITEIVDDKPVHGVYRTRDLAMEAITKRTL